MPCPRRPSLHCIPKNLGAATYQLQIRWNSSRPQIQVVSEPPQVTRPSFQDHKWSFSNSLYPSTPSTEHDVEPRLELRHKPRERIIKQAIEYNPTENRLLDILRKTEQYLNKGRSPRERVSLYFVGGWVRDKLLGRPPPDIDIVVRNMTPVEFVQQLIDLNGFKSHSPRLLPLPEGLEKPPSVPGMRTRRGATNIVGTRVFDYEKQDGRKLQVAAISIFTMEVRLQITQVFGDGAEMEVLQDDAIERELGVNAIYLKVNNRALLDPLKQGIKDLKDKVFRAPKEPKMTLLDDPIRVLRLIRFASRFKADGFTVDEDLWNAAIGGDVRLALLTNVSPDRLYREVALLLSIRNKPANALRMIHDLKYYRDLFVPPRPDPLPPIYLPPSVRADNVDYVAAGWFVDRLHREWDLWAPFEEALIDLPTLDYAPRRKTNHHALRLLRENVLVYAYCIAAVMPWRKHPNEYLAPELWDPAPKTLAGSILWMMRGKVVKGWDLIDAMFENDARTMTAPGKVLSVLSAKDVADLKTEFGEFWAAHVLCAMIFEWCELCQGKIGGDALETLWKSHEPRWKEISAAVDRVRWIPNEPEIE